MASSNTANWSVYSRNRKANVEELSWWFQGAKYLQFALRASRTHLTPTTYQQSRQLFIRHKLARQSKIRDLLSGKIPKAATERGKTASDWPRCPLLNLPARTRQIRDHTVVILCSPQVSHLLMVPGSRWFLVLFPGSSLRLQDLWSVFPVCSHREDMLVESYLKKSMFIVSYLIFKFDFYIIKALRVKQLCSLVSNLSLFLWPLLKSKLCLGSSQKPRVWPQWRQRINRSVHQQRTVINFTIY